MVSHNRSLVDVLVETILGATRNFGEALTLCEAVASELQQRQMNLTPEPLLKRTAVVTKASVVLATRDLGLSICCFLYIREKARLRLACSDVHRSLMRCPIDLTERKPGTALSYSSAYVTDPVEGALNLAPFRLYRQQPLTPSLIGLGSRLMLSAPTAEPLAEPPSRAVDLDALLSTGFDRMWTVAAIPFPSEDSIRQMPGILGDLYSCLHCVTKVEISSLAPGMTSMVLDELAKCHRELSYLDTIAHRCNSGESYISRVRLGNQAPSPGSLESLHVFAATLTYLDLGLAQLGSCKLESLSPMVNLKYLNLDQTNISGDFQGLHALTNLEHLEMTSMYGPIEGNLSSLSTLRRLRHFSMSDETVYFEEPFFDPIGDISVFSSLVDLRALSVGYGGPNSLGRVSGNLESLSGLTRLRELSFHSQRVCGNIKKLSTLVQLRHLYLVCRGIRGNLSSLLPLVLLEELELDGTKVKGRADHAPWPEISEMCEDIDYLGIMREEVAERGKMAVADEESRLGLAIPRSASH